MIPSWKYFLSRYGAAFDDGVVNHFGDPLAEERAASSAGVICDLSQRELIAVEGRDAFTFLQGQLTCDLKEVTPTRSRLGAWCSPKGRVLVLLRVVHAENGFLLELPASQLESTLVRLRRYVLRAQVSLKDVSDQFVRIGLAGRSAEGATEALYEAPPESPDQVAAAGGIRLIRLHGNVPRYQFIGPSDQAEKLWRAAVETLTPAGHPVWSLLEILAGVPEISQSDEHLPQMINLDVLEGLSFKKGCYAGQEVIARTHHLGRLKRRMYLIGASAGEHPPPGAPIVDATATSEAGKIVTSAPRREEGGFAALAVLRIDAAESGALHLGSADGPRIELLDLPYSIADEAG
ncbi:MAG TPA: folate-binding protein [Gammaproteobacteria bacterium]|nr:folate-binding protein [Gammaproteobacteria bacterium]